MKRLISTAVLTMAILFLATGASAQQKDVTPDNGSWQLVSNLQDKSKVTVQFYTNDGTLMYEETLHNTRLNINKRKTVRHLNTVLKEVYTNWVKNRSVTTEKDIIAKKLK